MKIKQYVNSEGFIFIPTDDNICVFHKSVDGLLLDKWDYPKCYRLESQRDFVKWVDEIFASAGGRLSHF